MKAFLSYSLNDSEQYVLSILVTKLNEQGFIVSSNYSNYDFIDFERFSQINGSNLFIGVITATGSEFERVLKEWQTANDRRVPALLLVDDSVYVHPTHANNPNIIRFNRFDPNPSIEAVKNKIKLNSPINAPSDNAAAWALGGLAILALIGLLSNSRK